MTYLELITNIKNKWIIDLFLQDKISQKELIKEVGQDSAEKIFLYKQNNLN